MKKLTNLILITILICYSCRKNGQDPTTVYPTPVQEDKPINHNDIIGWWKTNQTTYYWKNLNVFESQVKYFGTDSFFYQVDGLSLGTSTGKWWWGKNDSLYIEFNDGYQPAGMNPFYPVTLPKLTIDSMYFHWQTADWSYRYKHFDSLMITSAPISIIAGTREEGFAGDGGQAMDAKFDHPGQIIFDKAGNLYVADQQNHRIRKITTDGIVQTFAGKSNFGGPPGDGILASESYLLNPAFLAIDDSDNVYVSCTDWNFISKITTDGIIHTIAGKKMAYGGFNGDGGPAINAELNSPGAICSDKKGNIYFVDRSNWRIRKINAAGIITTVAGSGERSTSGDGGLAINAAVDAGHLTCDTAGNLYFTNSNSIRKINVSTGIIETIAGNGTEEIGGENVPAISSPLKFPGAIQCDKSGNLYFFQPTGRMRKISANGILTTIAGCGIQGVFDYKRNGRHATAYGFSSPLGIGIAPDGSIYFSDSGNNRIMRISN